MSDMRAKMVINSVKTFKDFDQEELILSAVCKNEPYDEIGSDENNTYALFTPMAEMSMVVNNPNLLGKFKEGQAFYIDFTETSR